MIPAMKMPEKSPVILLVEDESVVREITGEVLAQAGYQVIASSGPREALRAARKHPGQIDLLLTDMVMPEMTGADLAVELLDHQPDLITIFMSGYAEHDVMKSVRTTAAIHIQKPFTIDALLTRVAEALDGGKQDRGLAGLLA